MKKCFFSGIIILFPLFITLWIITFLIKISTKPFTLLVRNILESENLFQDGFWIFTQKEMIGAISTCLILIAIFLIVFTIGFLGRMVFVHSFIKVTEKLFLQIPFVNKIYKACRDVTGILFSADNTAFSKVVWAPFPTSSQKALGLITNDRKFHIPGKEEHVPVLLPGTPNPTVGFLLLCPKSSVVETPIRPEDAMKWIISCGSSQSFSVISTLSQKNSLEKKEIMMDEGDFKNKH